MQKRLRQFRVRLPVIYLDGFRFIKRKSLAFVMAKSMQMKGRDGIGIFQKPLSLEYRKLNKGIAQAIKNDMKQLLIKK